MSDTTPLPDDIDALKAMLAEARALLAERDLVIEQLKAQIDKLSLLPLETPSVGEMQAFVKSEIVRWGDIVKKAGIAGTQ